MIESKQNMKNSGYNVYRTYLGIKLHFKSSDYDYSAYGPVGAKHESYEKRNDRFWFDKLAAKYKTKDIENFFIANFLQNDQLWSKELVTDECENVYNEWIKRTDGIRNTFYCDCCNIRNYLEKKDLKFNDLFAIENGNLPLICKLLVQGYITPETYAIFDILVGFVQVLDKKLKDNILWVEKVSKYNRYKYLMSHPTEDIEYFRSVAKDLLR